MSSTEMIPEEKIKAVEKIYQAYLNSKLRNSAKNK